MLDQNSRARRRFNQISSRQISSRQISTQLASERYSREDRLRSLECFVDRWLRRHAVLDDVGVCLAPELLSADLAPGGVESLIDRSRRPDELLYIGGTVRVCGIEPPRVILHDLRDGRRPPSEANLQVFVHDLGLH